MNIEDLVRPLRRGLSGLRTRVRALLFVLGTGRLAVFLGAALALLFWLDYMLRLPMSVRAVLLLLFALGAGTVLFRHLLRPLLRKLTDETLAASVERAHPRLNDRLRSSLAFARIAGDMTANFSLLVRLTPAGGGAPAYEDFRTLNVKSTVQEHESGMLPDPAIEMRIPLACGAYPDTNDTFFIALWERVPCKNLIPSNWL